MKKLFLLLSVCLLSLSLVLVGVVLISAETPPPASDGYEVGGTVKEFSWHLDLRSGELTVTGEGFMPENLSNAWSAYTKSVKRVTVGEGVFDIDSYSFDDCVNLEAVTLPESLTWIGMAAFANCVELEQIALPKGLSGIGREAFTGCQKLATVHFAADGALHLIGESAFDRCAFTELTIPEGVTEIDSLAFRSCAALRAISLPTTLETIAADALKSCNALEQISVAEGNSCYRAVDGCLIDSRSGTLIKGCKTALIPEGVVAIGEGAFGECGDLERITLPKSLQRIERLAFAWCSDLRHVTFAADGALTEIAEGAFEGCKSLPSITLPRSLKVVGSWAFRDCHALARVDMTHADALTSIGDSAFEDCDSLASITIPRSVTEIGHKALSDCDALEQIAVESGNNTFSAVGNCLIRTDRRELIAGCQTSVIPQDGSVEIIGESAFYRCVGLTSINIPSSVRSVGESAFYICKNLAEVHITDLAAWSTTNFEVDGNPMSYYSSLYLNGTPLSGKLVLPSGITKIGQRALEFGPWTEIVIPESVREIGSAAFASCENLVEIVIPESVTVLGDGVLGGCTSLVRVTLPSSMERLGNSFFSDCTQLSSVTIPAHVTEIGRFAFWGCDALERITLPSGVKTIGEHAFWQCKSLTEVVLPNGLRSIGGSAFQGCTSLQSIHLPDSLSSLEPGAFFGCESLVQVTVPGSVRRIRSHTFADCKSLTSVVLGEGILWVEEHAFENCPALTTVTFPHSLIELRSSVFYKSKELQTICYCGTAEEWEAVRRNEKWLSNADEVRMVYHNYLCKKIDSKTHRDVCSLCGDKRAAEKHTWGAWMSKDAQQHERVCDCGYAKQADHEWNEQNVCSACGFANPTEPTPAAGCASSLSGGVLVLIPLIGGAAWIARRRRNRQRHA